MIFACLNDQRTIKKKKKRKNPQDFVQKKLITYMYIYIHINI